MIKISKLADYSVVILVAMAERSGNILSASVIAGITKLPEPTVSKILKSLSKAGVLKSMRGINGGYSIVNSPDDISVETIIRAIDGPVTIAACADEVSPDCGLSESCSVRGRWDDVNTAIRNALGTVTLADMLKSGDMYCSVFSKNGEGNYGSN